MKSIVDTDIFLDRAIKIWKNTYDYSKTKYIRADIKVLFICKKHGNIYQLPANHLKYGCGKCGKESNKRCLLLKENCKNNFIEKARVVHLNKYDYSKTLYNTAVTKVIITCVDHGDFIVTPNNHLRGKGCPPCGLKNSKMSRLKLFDEYYKKFKELYDDKYDYSLVKWEGGSKEITVICKFHGQFKIIPYKHRNGNECQKCSNQFSMISIDWILFMEIKYGTKIQHAKNNGEFMITGTKYKADGYSKELNIIFEFYGDFWHGNPKIYDLTKINSKTKTTYNELYMQTLEKTNIIKNKGYKLVEIWESDWKQFIKCLRCIQKKWKINYKNENTKAKTSHY